MIRLMHCIVRKFIIVQERRFASLKTNDLRWLKVSGSNIDVHVNDDLILEELATLYWVHLVDWIYLVYRGPFPEGEMKIESREKLYPYFSCNLHPYSNKQTKYSVPQQ